jgi:medium-chain acyl-[acyl-carrier-protein] hydrolase
MSHAAQEKQERAWETRRGKLFCFPFAGAGTSIFRHWPQLLPSEISVHPIKLPGREVRIREAAFREVRPAADVILGEIRSQLDEPFVLFGHSMGALMAFEVARHLRKQSLPSPRLLIASGAGAPHLSRKRPITYNLPEAEFVQELIKLQGTPLKYGKTVTC